MAYTEKVSISGTALSLLLYECVNSLNGQEGFLIGNITSEITNHISDSQSDSARLDTQISVRTVLPLPTVSLFYMPTGRIKEDFLKDLLSTSANEVVGWYKYRTNSNVKPTFRDKLISKGLQKFFEKHYNKKTFVTCNLTNKVSASGSTHTLMYRFGKINCIDMYEFVEDVTANLGEKLTGYKKANRGSSHGVFSKIVKWSNVQTNNPADAILHIQEAVNVRLAQEAKIAAKNESIIRELEAEIKQMTSILSDNQAHELNSTYCKVVEEELRNMEVEMAKECAAAVQVNDESSNSDINFLQNKNNTDNVSIQINEVSDRSPSPVFTVKKKPFSYSAALKKNNTETASTSKTSDFCDDLISFDADDKPSNKPTVDEDTICLGDSPEL